MPELKGESPGVTTERTLGTKQGDKPMFATAIMKVKDKKTGNTVSSRSVIVQNAWKADPERYTVVKDK